MRAPYADAVLAVPCRFCIAPVGRECFETTNRVGPAVLNSVRPVPHPSRVKDAGLTYGLRPISRSGNGWVTR